MVHNWAQILLIHVMETGKNNKFVNCSSAYPMDSNTSKYVILWVVTPAIFAVSGFLLLIKVYKVPCFVIWGESTFWDWCWSRTLNAPIKEELCIFLLTYLMTSVKRTTIHWFTYSHPLLWTFVINKLVLLRKNILTLHICK